MSEKNLIAGIECDNKFKVFLLHMQMNFHVLGSGDWPATHKRNCGVNKRALEHFGKRICE